MIFRLASERVLQNCVQYLSGLKLGYYEVVIRKARRSNNQNSYYWSIVGFIADGMGHSVDEMHEALKRNFIGYDSGVDCFGNSYLKSKSSAGLSRGDFADYLTKVILFADSQGIEIPTQEYLGLTERK